MTNSLDLEHLKTLVAIAECGGFGKAAAARHVSQPALSHQVRQLERTLRRKLFEKDGRGMRFTPEGERVLVEARRIVEVHDASLRSLAAEQESVLVVGSTEHAAEEVLPALLETLRSAFPDRGVRFQIARSTQLRESAERGTVDLALVLDPSGRGTGRDVGTLPLQWYAAPHWSPPAAGEPWPLVAFEEPCGLRERALGLLSDHGHRVEVAAESTTMEGVLAGARAGLGVALLPSTGGRTWGLVARTDLPSAGDTGVRLVSRRGLAPGLERTASAVAREFFAPAPLLELVGPTAPAPVLDLGA